MHWQFLALALIILSFTGTRSALEKEDQEHRLAADFFSNVVYIPAYAGYCTNNKPHIFWTDIYGWVMQYVQATYFKLQIL